MLVLKKNEKEKEKKRKMLQNKCTCRLQINLKHGTAGRTEGMVCQIRIAADISHRAMTVHGVPWCTLTEIGVWSFCECLAEAGTTWKIINCNTYLVLKTDICYSLKAHSLSSFHFTTLWRLYSTATKMIEKLKQLYYFSWPTTLCLNASKTFVSS